MNYYVYLLASRKNGTLYIGMTNNLKKRVYEHRNGIVEGFTKRYHVHMLVYFEIHDSPSLAIEREKNLKEWKRYWKVKLIQENNPEWVDLYEKID